MEFIPRFSYSIIFKIMKARFKTCYLAVLLTSIISTAQSWAQDSLQQQNIIQNNEVPIPNLISKQPEFPGGNAKMWAYINKELRYPEDLAAFRMEGRVVVRFKIMPNGSIGNIRITKTTHPLFSKEVIRIIKNMPQWSPAINAQGEGIEMEYILPITFQPSLLLSSKTPNRSRQPAPIKDTASIKIVEEQPEFPGGDIEMMKFIQKNLRYPPFAQKNGIQGRVTVSFIVERDGSITGVEVLRSPAEELSNEAIRVVKCMPKWKPGTQRGKPVRVKFMMPITFRLQ